VFAKFLIKDSGDEINEESQGALFIMQERKYFYTFFDLSNYISYFDNNLNNNFFSLFLNYILFRDYLIELDLYDIYFFEIFKFLEKPIDFIKKNDQILVYKNLYYNPQNIINIYYFFFKQVNLNNKILINLFDFYNNFYHFFLNKAKENIF
jgi:hypothetical protein